jgi:hypothetical protein
MIIGPDGQRLSRKTEDKCPNPRCKGLKKDRENAAGFGPPVWICGLCGTHIEVNDER